MKRNLFTNILTILVLLTAVSYAQAQKVTTHSNENEAKKNAGQGITFKIPPKVIPTQWKNFKGMLMLGEKSPSGVFISYVNEGETVDKLKTRAEKAIALMFAHEDKKVDELVWETKSVPVHKGDKPDSGVARSFDNDEQALQITTYEREWNGLKLIYGYFARKSKTSKSKDDSANFLDENGKGSKVFDAFWKSFPDK